MSLADTLLTDNHSPFCRHQHPAHLHQVYPVPSKKTEFNVAFTFGDIKSTFLIRELLAIWIDILIFLGQFPPGPCHAYEYVHSFTP